MITRRSFTLIEIMISMTLLALISSTFIYKGWDLICEQRFLSSARRVHAEVSSARLNAISYEIDLKLTFEKVGSKSILVISATKIPSALETTLNKKILLANLDLQGEMIFYANGYCDAKDQLILKPIKGNAKDRVVNPFQIDRMKVI